MTEPMYEYFTELSQARARYLEDVEAGIEPAWMYWEYLDDIIGVGWCQIAGPFNFHTSPNKYGNYIHESLDNI